MYKRFHGVDLHKRYATISVRNEKGEEIKRISCCTDFMDYISRLTHEDAVILETLSQAFYWSDEIEKTGARCIIIDSFKFKVISESWIKTDKRDAATLSLALWVSITNREFNLPEIYKPAPVIRDLRRLFSEYLLLNKQIRQYRNIMQAHLLENGIVLEEPEKKRLFNPREGLTAFESLELNHATRICIIMNLYLLWNLYDQKEILIREIYRAGEPLKEKVVLLLSIKGVSPLLALAFLADVGDISRFKSARKLNAYLGVVPRVRSSGGKTHMGHINRQSRGLSRSLFTQSIIHFREASPGLHSFYNSVKERRGAGRSRIAVLRKVFSIMRRMLLDNKEFRFTIESNHREKIHNFNCELNKLEHMAHAR